MPAAVAALSSMATRQLLADLMGVLVSTLVANGDDPDLVIAIPQ